MRKLLLAALATCSLLALAPTAGAGGAAATKLPSSLVVLGNSAADGYGSEPTHPYHDAPGNSWATGANAAVDSVYSRILVANPAVRGHAIALAHHDATIDDLAGQARKAVSLKPELVLVEIEGDVRCDGDDQTRVADFGTKLGDVLDTLTTGLPKARIFLVSAWGSFPSYVKYLEGLAVDARLKHAGKSVCQMVESPSGRVVPSHVAYIEKFVKAYDAQLAAVCSRFPACRYDGGAAQRMAVTAADISLDQNHLTIQGQARLAGIEWAAMAGFVGP